MAKALQKAAEPRLIRDKAFSNRLNSACDSNSQVPAYNFGRLSWVRDHLASDKGITVSTETVRKWFSGEARPRPDKMRKLAQMLAVDEAWLSLGITPEMQPDERQSFNSSANGAVNIVAGIIQVSGGHPAIPEEKDSRTRGCNLLAIMKGKAVAMHVCLGQETDSGYRFVVPAARQDTAVIGVVQSGPLKFDFLRFDEQRLEKHVENKGGFGELNVRKDGAEYLTRRDTWEKIKSFKEKF